MTQPPSSSGPLTPQPHGGWSRSAPPPGGGPHAPATKPSKAPTVLLILGGAILALSVVIGIVVAVIGFGGVASGAAKFEVFASGSGTYTAEEGEVVQLYAEEGTPAPQCQVDGPSVNEQGTMQSSTFGDGEGQWASFDSFTAEEAGDYTIDCGDTPVMVGPPVSLGGIFAGLGGIFLAIGGGALGLLLLAIGVVLLLLRRRRG
ncbi:hypothetical protein [Brachybacterium saurashtrense]|uniref:Uncharacterized protein n=1 Tax=Brachybacterium saurashtrense TaxID=556288 RepID=A0A345YPP7_9MICO|nr:hypothetical protein [Brachybacterium saurashtrense]AXK45899.1 hypothetical protein DWV08_09945 [Brachybacterium saurashtrense]RRR23637.1 hypothetical protein DXU92_01695 [Brachybacterium saurashtrense]